MKHDFSEIASQIWRKELPLLKLIEEANSLSAEGRSELAAILYQTWLNRNRTTHDHLVLFNLGVILFNQNDLVGARDAYARAVSLDPTFLQPRFNLGLVYERSGNSDAATAQWQDIANRTDPENKEHRPLLLLALNNLGRHYEERGRLADALSALTRSLRIDPNQPDVIHHWVFLRAKQCIWPVYDPLPGLDESRLQEYTSALAMISLSENPETQLTAARRFVSTKTTLHPDALAPESGYRHKKLRIAYCSSDFCLHPVAMLTVELLELHDRKKFEIYAFDWSREDGSSLRNRVISAVDRFERIHGLSDEAAARKIREFEIDILIDLQGQTLGARPNMLAYRPAPIQITYLGLPATTGLPFIDYVIADRYLIPDEQARFYSETPLYMPDVYQVCDRKRTIADSPTRTEAGIPENAFVFCSFNNNYKFNPDMFAAWARIIQQVPNSILWLLADNPWAETNLRHAAVALGLPSERLYFAPRVSPDKYLARFTIADLFLDTYPFNAGTTANDALFAGLPVLTRSGKTFASRMAGSLLHASNLDQLITSDLAGYEQAAVYFGTHPEELKVIRQQLNEKKAELPIFDTPKFVRALEKQLLELKPATPKRESKRSRKRKDDGGNTLH